MSYTVSFTPKREVPTTVTPLAVTVTGAPTSDVVTGEIMPSFGNVYAIAVATTDETITGYTGVISYKNRCCKTVTTSVTFREGITGQFYYNFVFNKPKWGKAVTLILTPVTA